MQVHRVGSYSSREFEYRAGGLPINRLECGRKHSHPATSAPNRHECGTENERARRERRLECGNSEPASHSPRRCECRVGGRSVSRLQCDRKSFCPITSALNEPNAEGEQADATGEGFLGVSVLSDAVVTDVRTPPYYPLVWF